MRILHIWDQSGVASILAKWQRKIGHKVLVIKNLKHDGTGITAYYGGKLIKNKYLFVIKCIIAARKFDIIHLHDAWFMVAPIKILYPKKRIIMHYHGSIIRMGLKDSIRAKNELFVDKILVSTPDLLNYEYQRQPYYIPNPVDTDLFAKVTRASNDRCFTSLKKDNDSSKIHSLINHYNPSLVVDTQEHSSQVLYKDFPQVLEKYEYYADIPMRDGKLIKAHSMCGLQALSMGIKVIDYNMELSDELPEYHKPENVVQELEKYYVSD